MNPEPTMVTDVSDEPAAIDDGAIAVTEGTGLAGYRALPGASHTSKITSVSRVPENGTHGLKGGLMAQGRF
jgi:hypothetical protein